MKIQDARGLELYGDYVKYIHSAGTLISEDGTETSLGTDHVVYVPKDLIDDYTEMMNKVCPEMYGYRESTK